LKFGRTRIASSAYTTPPANLFNFLFRLFPERLSILKS